MKSMPAEYRAFAREGLRRKFDFVANALQGRSHLLGEAYSVVDAYLFVVLSRTRLVAVDLGRWPAITAYQQRVAARPAVQAALRAEGLLGRAGRPGSVLDGGPPS